MQKRKVPSHPLLHFFPLPPLHLLAPVSLPNCSFLAPLSCSLCPAEPRGVQAPPPDAATWSSALLRVDVGFQPRHCQQALQRVSVLSIWDASAGQGVIRNQDTLSPHKPILGGKGNVRVSPEGPV